MTRSMLQPIIDSTRARIEALLPAESEVRARALDRSPARDLAAALSAPGLQVIAEIKRRSPSAGPLASGLDPARQAASYVAGGAAAISVLTEPEFFDGSLDDLVAVREAVAVPVLRKDFTLHPVQIWEARAYGADAVLLIAAVLDDALLAELAGVAEAAGLAALVETHNLDEVHRALGVGAQIIGVNNRDLTTFVTDLATAEAAGSELQHVAVTVAESGVSDVAGAQRMAAAGYDAILVGEAAVKAGDPAAFIASLRRDVR
jgi:indole-3-glycerol phosphate synthase